MDKQMDICKDLWINMCVYRQFIIISYGQIDKFIDVQIDLQINRQIDLQINRQIDIDCVNSPNEHF